MSEGEVTKKDFLLNFHTVLAEDIRKLERNFVQLLVPIISGMAVFGMGMSKFLECQSQISINAAIFFAATTCGAIILLMIAFFASMIFGYTHRSNQIILSKIEKTFGVIGNGEVVPEKWNSCNDKKSFDLPEIYKFVQVVSIGLIVLCILSFLCIVMYSHSHISVDANMLLPISLVMLIPIGIFWRALQVKFQWNGCDMAYETKLRELCDDMHGTDTKK